MNQGKPIVAAIGTGGTISSIGRDSLDVLDYPDFGRKMDVAEAVGRYSEIATLADILLIPYRSVGSTDIGPKDWLELAHLIDRTALERPDITGFIITHGTATLEETAYFLNLVLKTDKTVVLVGAQRPASALSSDAGMNLVGAVRVAIAESARGLGVLVCMNDEIQSAREVSKTSTYRLQTFRSPDFGALGHVDGDGVQIYRKPARVHAPHTAFDVSGLTELPRVDIVYSYGGADGTAIDAFVAKGALGLVSAGLAPGIPTRSEREALLRAAASGVVIVQTSRAGSGRVAPRRYLRESGVVAGDNLNPQKARLLLALALTRTKDVAEIGDMFARY